MPNSQFIIQAQETNWHCSLSSINYIETSTWTRQDHNGYSHQIPSFIDSVLNLKENTARVYLPPDANTFLSTIHHCLKSKDHVNLMIGAKQPTPVLLDREEANQHCIAGASVWRSWSTDNGLDPDVVLVGIGVELTLEVIYATAILRRCIPELRVRMVNVMDLTILDKERRHPHALTSEAFDNLFTKNRPIHFNYHGYPISLQGLLFGRPNLENVTVAGYIEEGTTTTPFDMMMVNGVSRFHVAIAALNGAAMRNELVRVRHHELVSEMKHRMVETKKYIIEQKTGEFLYIYIYIYFAKLAAAAASAC